MADRKVEGPAESTHCADARRAKKPANRARGLKGKTLGRGAREARAPFSWLLLRRSASRPAGVAPRGASEADGGARPTVRATRRGLVLLRRSDGAKRSARRPRIFAPPSDLRAAGSRLFRARARRPHPRDVTIRPRRPLVRSRRSGAGRPHGAARPRGRAALRRGAAREIAVGARGARRRAFAMISDVVLRAAPPEGGPPRRRPPRRPTPRKRARSWAWVRAGRLGPDARTRTFRPRAVGRGG